MTFESNIKVNYIYYNSENRMRAWQNRNQTRQIHPIYVPQRCVILEKTCKSQNVYLISTTPKFILGIIKIIIKRMSTILALSSIKINSSVQFQYLTFQSNPEIRGVCNFYVGLFFFPFSLICKMTIFRKKMFTPFHPTPRVEGVYKDRICACMVLYAPFPLI